MKNYKLIPKIVLWTLMAFGIIVSVMFFAGGSEGTLEVAGDFLDIPLFTNLFLTWNYILLGLVCLVTVAVVIWEFVKMYKVDPKKALRSLCVVIGFVALVLLCWFIGSPEEVKIIGYEGADNVGTMAQLSDACLYLTYTLTCATLVALVWGVVYTKYKK
jgi:ABC-type Fe3+-siderophore transport system permease subunit